MCEIKARLTADLVLRMLVIYVAIQLACAWIQTFQASWPLDGAFELAGSFEEQLLKSLGISLCGLKETLAYQLILNSKASNLFGKPLKWWDSVVGFATLITRQFTCIRPKANSMVLAKS